MNEAELVRERREGRNIDDESTPTARPVSTPETPVVSDPALARALDLRPRALLMDEPLSNLDEELNLKLRAEILQLQAEFGFALLYVTHDREEAFALADRIVLVARGRAILEGDPAG